MTGEICFLSDLEAADDFAFAERVGGSLRPKEQCLRRGDRFRTWLVEGTGRLRFDRPAHHPPEVQFRTGGDIAAEADRNPHVANRIQRQDSAAQKEIRRRTMRNCRSGIRDGLALALAQVDAVSEDCTRSEEAELCVHVV
jgi:hypothetical protein